MKKALIFGVGGQAGSYLVDLLLNKGYFIYGTYHGKPAYVPKAHIKLDQYLIKKCDITSPLAVSEIIRAAQPDEIYNMASLMFAPHSWKNPTNYIATNFLAVSDILAVIQNSVFKPRFFQAGSAEVFDRAYPQDEHTLIRPRNPYGVSKAAAQELVRVYREEKGLFACTGIFFNMESPRRDKFFFTRKVTLGIKDIVNKKADKLELGNLSAMRDWGLTEEYVEAAWKMLQAKVPNDYVIGTGECHTCEEFVFQACHVAKVDANKVVYDKTHPVDVDKSQSNPKKIKEELGWEAKSKFLGTVKYLVDAELRNP